MRLADYGATALADHGIGDVFLVTGGGAMHLNDAIGRADRLRYVCCHHEQACTIAAQGYYRLTNRLAAVNVTTRGARMRTIARSFVAGRTSRTVTLKVQLFVLPESLAVQTTGVTPNGKTDPAAGTHVTTALVKLAGASGNAK